jgi:hypothetical protein
MENKEQNTGMSLEEATKVAVSQSEHLSAREQAMYVAGFQECIKWQSSQPINSAWVSVEDIESRFQNEDFITNLCLSYRHDYGLMGTDERNLIRLKCKEWLRSILNNWDNKRTHVFPSPPKQ